MSSYVLREARQDDVASIVQMLADDQLGARREDVSEPLNAKYVEAFADIARDPNNILFVAERDGTVIGCLQLTLIPGLSHTGRKRAQIEGVRVHSSQRGEGLGEKMIQHAIERAKSEGCGLVQLTTDASRKDAHRFYERLGFQATHVGMKLAID